jgi:hypothetical protein
MRGVNGGYARYYNKRHNRRGYLFQDRFKSVLCQDQQYAVDLIKYINLNPLRAGMVKSLEELANYTWCGHGAILGKQNALGANFQNREQCLCRFGENEMEAINSYLQFLIKSCSGEDMKTAGLLSETEKAEIIGSAKGRQSIIGDPEFVKKVRRQYQLYLQRKPRKADYPYVLETISKKVCTEYEISANELMKRGKKDKRSHARSAFCYQSHVLEYIPLSIIAGYLQMTIAPVAVLVKKCSPECG